MADRRIFRVALGPSHRGEASSLFKVIRTLLPFGSKPKVKGFGQAIISLDQGSEACAFAMYTGEFGFHGVSVFYGLNPIISCIDYNEFTHELIPGIISQQPIVDKSRALKLT